MNKKTIYFISYLTGAILISLAFTNINYTIPIINTSISFFGFPFFIYGAYGVSYKASALHSNQNKEDKK